MTTITTNENPRKAHSVGATLLAGLPLFTLLPLGLDIFLPSLLEIGKYFNNEETSVLAISIYILFWGVGQLFWGGVADSIGKKTIALVGLVIYFLGSFMIYQIQADQGTQFLAYRAMQSFGGSACFTAIFAVIRVRFEGSELNKAYSYLNGILAFIPVSAPLIGAYILEQAPWVFLFAIMAALGVVSIAWVSLSLEKEPEQVFAKDANLPKTSLLKSYLSVIASPRFSTYLFFALMAQSLFIYFLTVSPTFLIGKLGVTQIEFGQYFMIIAGVFMVFSFITPKLSQYFSVKSLIAIALILCIVGGLSMYELSSFNQWYSLIAPMIAVAAGCTLLLSSCPAKALADFKHNAGVASGLYTATTFGIGAAISALFNSLVDSTQLTEISLVYTIPPIVALAFLLVSRRVKEDSLTQA